MTTIELGVLTVDNAHRPDMLFAGMFIIRQHEKAECTVERDIVYFGGATSYNAMSEKLRQTMFGMGWDFDGDLWSFVV